MIKADVNVDFKPWFTKIVNPKKYLNKKLNKIQKVVPYFKNKKISFTILLTNSLRMKKLNKKFRNKNKKTDVLSFPSFSLINLKLLKKKNVYIGDIAISYEIINLRSNKKSFEIEFDKVWVHGLLHLVGYDHIKNKDFFIMGRTEKKVLKSISN